MDAAMKAGRLGRVGAGILLASALFSASGCLSDVPLDATPQQPVDARLIGTWDCLAADSATESTARVSIARATANTYEFLVRADDDTDRYEGYLSRVGRHHVLNIRVSHAQEPAPASSRNWTFVRYEVSRSGGLVARVMSDDAVSGVAQEERAMRKAVAAALASPTGFEDWLSCARAGASR